MQQGTISTASIAIESAPQELPLAARVYLDRAMAQIQGVIRLLAAGHLDQTRVAPSRPRDGDIRYADGSSWNPGSGEGAYMYYAADWNPLGAISTPTTFRAPLTISAPASPQDGDIILADGVGFDPGSGMGIYAYYSGAWQSLG